MADLLLGDRPAGAGTTTVAPLLTAAFEAAAPVRGDDLASWTRGSVPPWRPEAHTWDELVLRAAGAACGTAGAERLPVARLLLHRRRDGELSYRPAANGNSPAGAQGPPR